MPEYPASAQSKCQEGSEYPANAPKIDQAINHEAARQWHQHYKADRAIAQASRQGASPVAGLDIDRQAENGEAIWQGRFAVLSLRLAAAGHCQHHRLETGLTGHHHHCQNRQQATCAATALAHLQHHPEKRLEEREQHGVMAIELDRAPAFRGCQPALQCPRPIHGQTACRHQCCKRKGLSCANYKSNNIERRDPFTKSG